MFPYYQSKNQSKKKFKKKIVKRELLKEKSLNVLVLSKVP